MKNLAECGKTVVWQRKDRQTVLFTMDGAFLSRKAESLEDFFDKLDNADTW